MRVVMINNPINQAGSVVSALTEMVKAWGEEQENCQPELWLGYLVCPLHSAGNTLFFLL